MKLDLTGKVFGRYTVINRDIRINKKRTHWNVVCSCGNKNIVRSDILTAGQATSCGCYHKEVQANRLKTHGGSFSPEYTVWENMVSRCTNPKNKYYKNYGERGITVSAEWLDFSNFINDMGNRKNGETLERVDNNGNYCKENCIWATRYEQARNKRSNRNITYNDVTMCLTDWAKSLGIAPCTLDKRLRKWTLDEALTRTITGATYTTDVPLKLRDEV